MSYQILSINPGSTSTKVAVYEDKTELFCKSLTHAAEELDQFDKITDQIDYRKKVILEALKEQEYDINSLSAVVGRGGMLPPLKAGGYLVNQAMKDRIINGPILPHASNLGALLADEIAKPLGIPAYIYDSVAADELKDVARITGLPEIIRQSFCHVLNAKATARKVAEKCGKRYEEMNFIVAHLGGGISISAHEKGRIVDVITDDGGPFSPERAGSIPLNYIVEICYSGNFSQKEMMRRLRGAGGMKAHLGTPDGRAVERMIEQGDNKAKLIYEAQAYQIAKGIGELSPTLKGDIDAVILTGGLAYSTMLTDWVKEMVEFIAHVEVIPGENEMEALSLGALRILSGEEEALEYME